jgi:hypothetical protein
MAPSDAIHGRLRAEIPGRGGGGGRGGGVAAAGEGWCECEIPCARVKSCGCYWTATGSVENFFNEPTAFIPASVQVGLRASVESKPKSASPGTLQIEGPIKVGRP